MSSHPSLQKRKRLILPAVVDRESAADYKKIRLLESIESKSDCVVILKDGEFFYRPDIHFDKRPDWSQDEEIVRALVLVYIVHKLGYPSHAVKLNHSIRARVGRGSRNKFADIAIFHQHNPQSLYSLIELKTEEQFARERLNTWESQLFALVPFIEGGPDYLVYGTVRSNDSVHPELEVVDAKKFRNYSDWRSNGLEVLSYDIPKNYNKPIKVPYTHKGENALRTTATQMELNSLRKNLHDVLWGGGANSDTDIFNLLTRLILAKVHDERMTPIGQTYRFQTLQGETLLNTMERIDDLYRVALKSRLGVTQDHADTRTVSEEGKGTEGQIRFAIESLEKYDFTELTRNANSDLMGDFFEGIMRTGFKQTKGQFFTHPNIGKFMVFVLSLPELAVERVISGKEPPTVIDPSAGSGTFLIEAMKKMTEALIDKAHEIELFGEDAKAMLNKISSSVPRHQWVEQYCYGMEIHVDLGLAAQVNMLLHADGSSAIFVGPERGDGLQNFSQYPSQRPLLSTSKDRNDYSHKVNENFDAVITNPPFSVKYSKQDIERYSHSISMLSKSKDSEDLFVDRWFQLLKEGGRLAAVVPNSLLA